MKTIEEVKEWILNTSLEVLAVNKCSFTGMKGSIRRVIEDYQTIDQNYSYALEINFFDESQYRGVSTSSFDEALLSFVKVPFNLTTIVSDLSQIAFFMKDNHEIPLSIEGQAFCPSCHIGLEISETQTEDLYWAWNPEKKQYIKSSNGGGSEGQKCVFCDYRLDDVYEDIFAY